MKVCQINCVYGHGSTGKIIEVLHHYYIEHGIDSLVIYGRGENIDDFAVKRVGSERYSLAQHLISKITGVMYAGCKLNTKKIIRIISDEKPDIVHLHCINGYFVNLYELISWLKEKQINTVVTLHAEFMYTGGCGYSLQCDKWQTTDGCGKCPRFSDEIDSLLFDRTREMFVRLKNAFSRFDDNLIITSVSPWLMKRAEKSIILGKKEHRTVLNGVNINNFFFDKEKIDIYKQLKKQYAPNGEKLILHVTPWFDTNSSNIKGSGFVLQIAEKLKEKDIIVAVAGAYAPGCEVPSNVILLGKIDDQGRLSDLYSSADLTILTSERETFSMVTAESLCCGTPVVGFQAGGPESFAQPEYSQFVEYGNVDALYQSVNTFLEKQVRKECISEDSVRRFSQSIMAEGYLSVYKELMSLNG